MQSQYQLRFYLFMFFILILVGTLSFQIFEGLSFLDSFYFCVVTIATVGYGDISPTTIPGRATALLLIIMGAGTFLGVMANATEIVFDRRGKKIRIEKRNILMGFFFSETGTFLLRMFTHYDGNLNQTIRQSFMINKDWKDKNFEDLKKSRLDYPFNIDPDQVRLIELKKFLNEKSNVLIRLLENPTLHDHEDFTELLIAILHLKEELTARSQLKRLSDSDRKHLAGDCKRVYTQLIDHWIDYVQFIKKQYPFLYSLAVRQNPFDLDAMVEIRE